MAAPDILIPWLQNCGKHETRKSRDRLSSTTRPACDWCWRTGVGAASARLSGAARRVAPRAAGHPEPVGSDAAAGGARNVGWTEAGGGDVRAIWAALAVAAVSSGVGGCVGSQSAWEYYDRCSQTSFVQMVDCGRRVRTSECTAAGTCSGPGNSFVAYADSLAASVRSKQMTDEEARRKFIEFKTTLDGQRRQEIAGSVAPSGPTVCRTYAGVTSCF